MFVHPPRLRRIHDQPRPAAPIGRRLVLGGAALILAVSMALGLAVWNLRRDALDQSRQQLSSLARVYAGQTAHSIQAIDIVLRDIVAAVGAKADDRAASADRLGTEANHRTLKERARQVPQASALLLIDPQGRIAATSREWPTRPLDVSDRAHVRYFLDNVDPDLYISMPVLTRTDSVWTIYLARGLRGADGRPAGVVLAAVPLQSIRDSIAALGLPPGAGFTLLRQDGTVFTRYPDPIDHTGQMMPWASPWHAVVTAGGGFYRSAGQFGNAASYVAVQPVPGTELVIDFVVSEATLLAPWRQQAAMIAAGASVLILACIGLILLVRRQVTRLEQASVTLRAGNAELSLAGDLLRASQTELAAQSRLLHTTLETMDQGLMAIDADRRVVLCNTQAIRLLDLCPEFMAARPAFSALLANRVAAGHYDASDTTMQALAMGNLLDRPHVHELRLSNDRVVEIRSVPIPGGGAVRTYTNVTERRQAEERIRFIAEHDPLTSLANRMRFNTVLREALAQAASDGAGVCVLYLDLDRFKQINDRLGHAVGDSLLIAVADRLRGSVRGSDCVARIGGDEFVIVQPRSGRPDGSIALARRLLEGIAQPYMIAGEICEIGVSIGIAWYPADAGSAEALLAEADTALYAAKHAGRNTVRWPGWPDSHEAHLRASETRDFARQ